MGNINSNINGNYECWKNSSENFVNWPDKIIHTTSLNDPGDSKSLVSIMKKAKNESSNIKVVGTGHCHNGILDAPEILVTTKFLKKISSVGDVMLESNVDP